ncbi:MAG TPA: thermonuclease family protein [Blastocatellia bacterium]|nr:thermonuclease family protein [Blastocatellia bacterium]
MGVTSTLLGIILLVITAAPVPKALARCTAPAFPVVYVIDGDTIVVANRGRRVTVRLLGIDAPETKDPRRPPELGGREAAEFLERLLHGECVLLSLDEHADTIDGYGRVLAYVTRERDGLCVNMALVASGHARAIRHFMYGERSAFLELERRARAARIGMWRRGAP